DRQSALYAFVRRSAGAANRPVGAKASRVWRAVGGLHEADHFFMNDRERVRLNHSGGRFQIGDRNRWIPKQGKRNNRAHTAIRSRCYGTGYYGGRSNERII